MRFSVMAISGSPSIAFEIARILEHAFQYYRRRLLQENEFAGEVAPVVAVD